jgi:hypothetical protein
MGVAHRDRLQYLRDEVGLELPPARVDLADIRAKYHAAEQERGTMGTESAD